MKGFENFEIYGYYVEKDLCVKQENLWGHIIISKSFGIDKALLRNSEIGPI